jgi:hypothetical protein
MLIRNCRKRNRNISLFKFDKRKFIKSIRILSPLLNHLNIPNLIPRSFRFWIKISNHSIHPTTKIHKIHPTTKIHKIHPTTKIHKIHPITKIHKIHPIRIPKTRYLVIN